MRLTNGVAEFLPNQTFDIIVANVSRQTGQHPKHTVVGYEKRNPLDILMPERQVGTEISHALHITDVNDQAGKGGAGRPGSLENTTAEENRASTDDRLAKGPPPTAGTVLTRDEDQKYGGGLGKRNGLVIHRR